MILKQGKHAKYRPYAFAEQGVVMISSVLRSQGAIQVNIAIMRTFVQLRKFFAAYKEFAKKLNRRERTIEKHDKEISVIFEAMRRLMRELFTKKKRIGFCV